MRRSTLMLTFALSFVPLSGAAQQHLSACAPRDMAAPPNIAVRSVTVEGGGELSDPATAAAKRAVAKPAYRDCELIDALQEAVKNVGDVYQEHGYFGARMQDPVRHAVGSDQVDVVIPVTPGPLYRIAEIKFTHATVFSIEQLRPLFSLYSDGYNPAALRQGLERLRQLYASRGYINFVPIPTPSVDDNARTFTWTIDLDEGAKFTFGHLVLDGPEPAAGVGKRLIADWQPLIGQAYNPELLKRFLQEHATLLRMRNPDPEGMFDGLIDNEEHIVTVRLNFPD